MGAELRACQPADVLNILVSMKIVKSHYNRALKKAGATNRLQLSVQAYKPSPKMVLNPQARSEHLKT